MHLREYVWRDGIKCERAKMRKLQHQTNPKLKPNPNRSRSTNPNLTLTVALTQILTQFTGVFCTLSVVIFRIFALLNFAFYNCPVCGLYIKGLDGSG